MNALDSAQFSVFSSRQLAALSTDQITNLPLGSTMRLTTATWPSGRRALFEKARTAPTLGSEPRA